MKQLYRNKKQNNGGGITIPKWSGSEKTTPLEFFEAIEGTARIGNWSDIDKI
jgi:hypothetical protein